MATRTPLMAGNWKMNLDHLQATHLAQTLDWSLRAGNDHGRRGCVLPFTDLRTVQTLVDGDKLESSTAVRTFRFTTPALTPARSPAPSSPSSAAPMSRSATVNAVSTTTRPTRS